jgi:hypothetical protein
MFINVTSQLSKNEQKKFNSRHSEPFLEATVIGQVRAIRMDRFTQTSSFQNHPQIYVSPSQALFPVPPYVPASPCGHSAKSGKTPSFVLVVAHPLPFAIFRNTLVLESLRAFWQKEQFPGSADPAIGAVVVFGIAPQQRLGYQVASQKQVISAAELFRYVITSSRRLHAFVVGTAATFGNDPVDDLVGVGDVAGFAVDAIGKIYF